MLERPEHAPAGIRDLARDLGWVYVASGVVAFIFAASGPVAVILAAGAKGGLGAGDLSSWIFGSFFINGLITLAFTLYYRQPLVFFWTIPGTVLVGQALEHMSFAQAIGAYYVTGILMLALGLTGLVRRAMDALPMPVVMAMVAGVFLQFGLDLIFALRDGFWIAAPMVAVFLMVSAVPAVAGYVPPLIAAMVLGGVAVALQGSFTPAEATFAFILPKVQTPAFAWGPMIELVIPLAVTVLAAQNAQGLAVMRATGHTPPVNAITAACGLGSLATALVGTVSTCLTGAVSAILCAAGDPQRRYSAAFLVGVLSLVFGVFSGVFTKLMLATPAVFIAAVAGLAMLTVLQRAFVASFQGRFSLGALTCFLVTVANVPLFNIGAPFWGLVAGALMSRLLERHDFVKETEPEQ